MAKKSVEWADPTINPDVIPEVLPEVRTTDINELNKIVVLPYQEFDCVMYSGIIPIDVALSKAYYVLKIDGTLIIPKVNFLPEYMDVALSLFDIQESNEDSIIFVKVR